LLAILPEKFRVNIIQERVITQIKRPEPGHLGSPFEKIRSAEIVGIFERWFTIEWRKEFTGLLHLVAPPGMRAAYVENEDTKALSSKCFSCSSLDRPEIANTDAPGPSAVYQLNRDHRGARCSVIASLHLAPTERRAPVRAWTGGSRSL